MSESERSPSENRTKDARFSRTTESAGGSPAGRSGGAGFGRDFLTGCLAVAAAAAVGLVLVPILILVFKLSALFVVPLGLIAIFVILTAFLGRIINMLRDRWPRGKG